MHTPPWHVSLWVQASPSLHAAPSTFGGLEQAPVAGSHTPAAWQTLGIGQTTAFWPVQTPPWQVSVCVQALPSLHAVAFGFAGFEQPVTGSHVPTLWHWSLAVHTTGFWPVQTPLWHVSVCVQTLASLQAEPLALGAGLAQTPVAGLQAPMT